MLCQGKNLIYRQKSAMLTKSPAKKKKFLNSVNYFRGIAIIIIVLGHCYELSNWNISSNLEKLFYSLTLNGSVYFVFISGFLYRHIFYDRFEYKKFLLKKIQYVLVPYLVCSTLPIIYTVFISDSQPYIPISLSDRPLSAIGWYLITGRVADTYWYVPMAMLLFALSPLVNLIIKSGKVLEVSLFLLPISLIIHRPINNINAVHSLVYYFPLYLIGVWASANHQKITYYLQDNKRKLVLLLWSLGLGIVQVWLLNSSGNFHKEFWSITVPDVNLLQKILLCFLFMSILNRYEESDIGALKQTAATSFAIYFIHPLIIYPVLIIFDRFGISFEGNFFTLVITSFLILATSMAVALGVKAIFKKKSRYLIGW